MTNKINTLKALIAKEASIMNKQHKRIHETCKNRHNDYETWHKACNEFRSYTSPIDVYIDGFYKGEINADLVEFAICFLELDAWFFRSGYIKEKILEKLKSIDFSNKQSERLNKVLLDAVEHRGHREYARYCRLATVIATPKLIWQLETIVKHSEAGARRSRAKLMLKKIKQKEHITNVG